MFFKFPHTPHLVRLGRNPCRDDKVLSAIEAREFLDGEIAVEEKLDGANIGFSLDESGTLRVQNRGNYLSGGSHPQFQPLWPWMEMRRFELTDALKPGIMLFGEWCFARHSVSYSRLPDWFLGFDVYDPAAKRFWSVQHRNELLSRHGLHPVPELARGRFSIESLLEFLGTSRFTDAAMEGVYLRRETPDWLESRAKLVRAEFTAGIGSHWSDAPIEKNRLDAHINK